MPTYKVRPTTSRVILHASHTHPDKSNLKAFLSVNGRKLGLLDIGFHYVILQDGRLLECRPHTVQGTHLRHGNRDSIGVCLAGGLGWVTCSDCNGSGMALSPLHGEPVACHACHGDTVVEDSEDNFTDDQLDTLRGLMGYLGQFYGDLRLLGHSEASPHHIRQCPPIDMEKVRQWVKTPANHP